MSKVLSQELGIQRHREICPFPEVSLQKVGGTENVPKETMIINLHIQIS